MNPIWSLFWTFLKIGLLSIGGGYAVIPLIQEQVVNDAGWISEKVFTDIVTISQMTPGPLAVNTSTFVGLQIGGIAGAAAATLGCILCGVVISLVLYHFFQTHRDSTYALEVLNGLKSASLGLIISAAATILVIALCGSRTVEAGTFFFGVQLDGIRSVFIDVTAAAQEKAPSADHHAAQRGGGACILSLGTEHCKQIQYTNMCGIKEIEKVFHPASTLSVV